MRVTELRPSAPTTSDAWSVSGYVAPHQQTEIRIALRFAREEIEKVPLRHERDEAVPRRQPGEIRDFDVLALDLRMQRARFCMRELQKFIRKTELVHHL